MFFTLEEVDVKEEIKEKKVLNKDLEHDTDMNTCHICNKQFSSKSNLSRHTRIHSWEKPFYCNLCDKTFSRKSYLTQHKKVHTDDKPYSCDECGKSFSVNSHLTNHRRIHSGQKPYSCDHCEKSFTQVSSLQVHIKSHTGEKPFSCKLCDKHYFTCSELTRHDKSPGHLEMVKTNSNTVLLQCEVLDIKKEIKEEELFDEDPLSIQIKAENME